MIRPISFYEHLLEELGILQTLADYKPEWVGTIPIDVHLEESDIDIVCKKGPLLHTFIHEKFGHLPHFKITKSPERIVCNFSFKDVPFEIYAEDTETRKQNGYLHMIAERNLLNLHGEALREQVRAYKRAGFKTEPAFAKALKIEGNPYEELLKFI
jgi:hypothetical protein